MKYDYIVWDFNGTIIDDLQLCRHLLNDLLRKRHLKQISTKRYREVFKFPVIEYYKEVGFDFNLESFDDVSVEFISKYQPRSLKCGYVRHSVATIKKLIKRGYINACISASEKNNLLQQLEHFKIKDLFVDIVAIDNIKGGSKLENALKWREKVGQDKKILMIGDTLHDAEVAKAINADCRLVTIGSHQNKKRLQTSGFKVIRTAKEILKELD